MMALIAREHYSKRRKKFSKYGDFKFFFTHPYYFYREIKHRDQSLSTTLKSSKERKIYFYTIEIYCEKAMT